MAELCWSDAIDRGLRFDFRYINDSCAILCDVFYLDKKGAWSRCQLGPFFLIYKQYRSTVEMEKLINNFQFFVYEIPEANRRSKSAVVSASLRDKLDG